MDNLHNIVSTLKSYDHGADLKAAANMQLVISRLPSEIAEWWSRRKLELKSKGVDLVELDRWLETEVQVKEMAFGCPKTIEILKQDGGKFRPNSGRSRWSKKQKDVQTNTFATSGTKDECPICKQECGITLCETLKKAVVNDRWTLLCTQQTLRHAVTTSCSYYPSCLSINDDTYITSPSFFNANLNLV